MWSLVSVARARGCLERAGWQGRSHLGRLVGTLLELRGSRRVTGRAGQHSFCSTSQACLAAHLLVVRSLRRCGRSAGWCSTSGCRAREDRGSHLLHEVQDLVREGRVGERESLGVRLSLQMRGEGGCHQSELGWAGSSEGERGAGSGEHRTHHCCSWCTFASSHGDHGSGREMEERRGRAVCPRLDAVSGRRRIGARRSLSLDPNPVTA